MIWARNPGIKADKLWRRVHQTTWPRCLKVARRPSCEPSCQPFSGAAFKTPPLQIPPLDPASAESEPWRRFPVFTLLFCIQSMFPRPAAAVFAVAVGIWSALSLKAEATSPATNAAAEIQSQFLKPVPAGVAGFTRVCLPGSSNLPSLLFESEVSYNNGSGLCRA